MNREHKFRGYCERDSEWRYGYYISDGNQHEVLSQVSGSMSLYTSPIDPESLGEWAGVYDTEMREVYEGSILRSPEIDLKHYVSGAYCYGEVIFKGGAFLIQYKHDDNNCYYDPVSEARNNLVVGNVYENGELVK
jgi:hypothetical protein